MTRDRPSTGQRPSRTATSARSRPNVIRVLIVDDHPLMREGLAARIGQEADMEVCGEADCTSAALGQAEAANPDVAIIDLSLKDSHGLDLIKRLRASRPKIRILVMTAHSEVLYGERVIHLGAQGFINKQQAQTSIIAAIRCVAAGRRYLSEQLAQRLLDQAVGGTNGKPVGLASLSDRELEVFELIGTGWTTRAIAEQLHLSVHTIETYRENIRAKLALKNASELMQRAVQWVIENR